MTNKYVFLDIDGVLNSMQTIERYGGIKIASQIKHSILVNGEAENPFLDEASINLLKAAHGACDFKIVMSSAWRHSLNVSDFHIMFDFYKWDTRNIIIGKTDMDAGIRGYQIARWLNNWGKPPYKYVIIDDSSDFLEVQRPYHIQTSFESGGFTEKHYKQLLEILN